MRKTDKNVITLAAVSIIAIIAWLFVQSYQSTEPQNDESIIKDSLEEKDKQNNEQENDPSTANTEIIETLTPTKLNQMMNGDELITIIDTRSKNLYENGHIRSSIHHEEISIDDMARTIVLVSETGNEDLVVSYYNDLSRMKTVYNLSGGVREWQSTGYPLLSLNTARSFTSSSKINYIEPRDLHALIQEKNDMVIIDTRRVGNYENEHIPSAINIPLTQIEFRYKEIPRTKELYVYGADDDASFQSGILLYDLQFIGTKTIKGGFSAWKEFGYPTTDQD